jgi:HD domain
MAYTQLIPAMRVHVIASFKEHSSDALLYHNVFHTLEVETRAIEIGEYYSLPPEALFILHAAALFHDIAYPVTGPKNHEEESVRKMNEYLTGMGVEVDVISKIEEAILATKRLGEPGSVFGKIICDADTYHFGTADFRKTDDLVKRELELLTGSKFPEWINNSILMLKNHKFYTSYCQDRLNKGKAENIAWLNSLVSDIKKDPQ